MHSTVTDLLSETDDGFTLMAYLRAMFAFEWSNFKERLRRQVGAEVDIPDWSQVTELDFGSGAAGQCREGGYTCSERLRREGMRPQLRSAI